MKVIHLDLDLIKEYEQEKEEIFADVEIKRGRNSD